MAAVQLEGDCKGKARRDGWAKKSKVKRSQSSVVY
jgi:hypothetical protein